MDITSELMNKVRNAESPEELLEIAKENEANISLDDAKMIYSVLHSKKDQGRMNVNLKLVKKIKNSSFDYCSEDLVIHTPKGSYAEKYAIANKIDFDNEYI